ncbi:hypothetical protein TcCL_Unassigned03987 [Trypanosoma cruzi]|nr:hypothetical protein TcCL_Unassigned03987 [Trypanosoma cruzi]
MDHRHGRTGQKYYSCPTAQCRNSPLHRSRRLEPTCADTTLTRGVEAALARLRTGVLLNYGWLLRPLQPAIPGIYRRCGLDAAQQARNEPRTETPFPPAGPRTATIRCPADRPVRGKRCSCRTIVVTPTAWRAPRRCGKQSSPMCRNRLPALERGRGRETAHRPHLRHGLHSPGRSHSYAVSARRRTTNEPHSDFFSGTSKSTTAPGHKGSVPVNMTIRRHSLRSSARPVD